MAEEGAPLLRLAPPRSLSRRKRQLKFPPPPERVPHSHGRGLLGGIGRVREHAREGRLSVPALATDVPYVRVELAPKTFVTDAELRSVGLEPVYRREDAVLAAYSPDGTLNRLEERIGAYSQLKLKLQVLAKIESVQPWSREDRTSERLRALQIVESQSYRVDLLLMPWADEKPNPQAIRALRQFVEVSRGQVLDSVAGPTFAALRVRVRGQALNQILDYRDDVALVDLPPAAHVVVPAALSLSLDDVPEVEAPSRTAPAICIVDSGIVEGHPLLEPAIASAKSRSFPAELGPPVPAPPVKAAGHGTEVTGVALYGDVAAAAVEKKFKPALRIINARMLDDNNELDPDRMPLLRGVVEHVKDDCRVLNLSFGLEHHSGFLSLHAAELDALVREYGVLVVASSGNRHPRDQFGETEPQPTYPEFLSERAWRVRSPAEALNVLTVGGITPDSDPYPPKGHRKAVAPRRAPSPFGCTAGIKGVLKPELVEAAGNLAFDRTAQRWIDNDPGLRLVTTNPSFATGSLLSFTYGTSVAAPRVAHLAGLILARYPDASANLLRALLVQSAVLPEGVSGWKAQQAMRLCGFGVPNLDRALYCRPQRVTLYYEGSILPDEVQIFQIPVPVEFSKVKGRKAISVTVAYDPPVSVVHRDRPAGTKLTWGLARGDVSEGDLEKAIAAAAEEEEQVEGVATDPAPAAKAKTKSPFLPSELHKRPQQYSTVQKNVFAWKRGSYGETYRLAVTARAIRPVHADVVQRFAVVVSLECEADDVNVFNLIRARLGAARLRVRLRGG